MCFLNSKILSRGIYKPLEWVLSCLDCLMSASGKSLASAWTLKVCEIIAFLASLKVLGHHVTYFGGLGNGNPEHPIAFIMRPQGLRTLLFQRLKPKA